MSGYDTRYRVCGRVVVRTIGDQTLLVPVGGASAGACVYPVNETALLVWRCLSEGGTIREAAGMLTERFEVAMEEAMSDAAECARAFMEDLLLEEQDG